VTRSLLTLAVAIGLASLGVWLAKNLQLDTGLEALLPSDSVSVLSINETRQKLALDEPLTILVDSKDVERNKELTAELGRAFSEWPETAWVMTSYGLDELAERALYYVDGETLYEWSELAEEALDWEVCKLSPLCVTIADPPELPDGDEVRHAVDISPAGTVLRELTGQSAKQVRKDEQGESEGPRALCNDEGTTCAVQVMLSGTPGDLAYARMIKKRAEAITRPLAAAQDVDTRIEVIGRYRAAPMEHEIIVDDLRLVSVLAALGALLVVLVFFRDLTAVVQLMVPMLSGLAVAIGLIALIEPKINIISASALAILAGMAIDFGIHLLMHYQAARAEGHNAATAAKTSVRDLWVALLVAGLTTACGFAALSMTDFQGFSQMGWMASLGIVVTLLWTLAVFPAMVHLLPGRVQTDRQPSAKAWSNRRLASLGLVVGLLAAPLAAQVGFESNLGKLQPEGVGHGLDASMMRARGNINALYLSDSREAIDAALADTLMTEGAEKALGVEPIVVSAQVILPEDSDEKTETLSNLKDTLKRAREKGIERDNAELLAELDELEPWLDHIPAPARLQRRGDGATGKLARPIARGPPRRDVCLRCGAARRGHARVDRRRAVDHRPGVPGPHRGHRNRKPVGGRDPRRVLGDRFEHRPVRRNADPVRHRPPPLQPIVGAGRHWTRGRWRRACALGAGLSEPKGAVRHIQGRRGLYAHLDGCLRCPADRG
jgi:hypothetical protein